MSRSCRGLLANEGGTHMMAVYGWATVYAAGFKPFGVVPILVDSRHEDDI